MVDDPRWFAPEELERLSCPTMGRAIEALEPAETETALALDPAEADAVWLPYATVGPHSKTYVVGSPFAFTVPPTVAEV